MNIDDNIKPKVKLKTISFIAPNKYKPIFNNMTYTSKNIYNCCIYTNNIFDIFKNDIFEELYYLFISIKNSTLSKKQKYKMIRLNNLKIIISIFKKYYDIYTANIELAKINNNIIYNYIKNKLVGIVLNNSNIESFYDSITNELKNIVEFNEINKNFVFTNIINKIIKSFYNKNYFLCKYQIKNHIPLTVNNIQLIKDIKNNNYWYDFNKIIINYKEKIEEEFKNILKDKYKLPSNQYIFKCLVYEYSLSNNKKKLPADIILNIIDKYYEAIKSYYGKLNNKLKANKPKYLDKIKGRNNLYYYPRSFKICNNNIRLTVGTHISKVYNELYNNEFYKINDKKYCRYEHIIVSLNNLNKKDFLKIDNGYVNKKNIINANFLYIKYPKILKDAKIKLIQIKSYGNTFTVYVTYETTKCIPSKNIKPSINNSISIDLGMKNLMTIYNPTGTQHIINGGKIKSLNEFYNNKIAELQSLNKKKYNIHTFNRMYSLLNERKNKLNGEINRIINLLITTYNNKNIFIVGYNHGWKTKVHLKKNTNRMFYDIPYKRILIKLEEKLLSLGKKLILNEESYTSICDSLNLEKIGKKEIYDGVRKNRGLFISKTGKALNADLNGAINIMRKVINLKKIEGIKLYNPTQLLVA
jgi:IS605 OrfB family transposase